MKGHLLEKEMNKMPSQASRYGVVVALMIALFISWIAPFDNRAKEIIDDSFDRAALTFAAARGLNAIISMAQGTEITIGIGAETTFSLGEVLDPINDLVEQFGDVMLMATVSLGIQKVLLFVASSGFVAWALTLAASIWSALYLTRRAAPRVLTGLVILALMARFAIPVAAVGTHVMFEAFLQRNYDASIEGIEKEKGILKDETSWWDRLTGSGSVGKSSGAASEPVTRPVLAANEPVPTGASDKGWWERSKAGVSDFLGTSKLVSALREKVEVLKRSAELTARHIIDLIVVFLLETLLFPLAIMWLLHAGIRAVFAPSAVRDLNRLLETMVRETRMRNEGGRKAAVDQA